MNVETKVVIIAPEGYELQEVVKDGTKEISFKQKIPAKKTAKENWAEVALKVFKVGEEIYASNNIGGVQSHIIVTGDHILYKGCSKEYHLTPDRVKQFTILQALVTARDYYNEYWTPNFDDISICKHYIDCVQNTIREVDYFTIRKILCFRTKDIRAKFLEDFREWIEICKEFI